MVYMYPVKKDVHQGLTVHELINPDSFLGSALESRSPATRLGITAVQGEGVRV